MAIKKITVRTWDEALDVLDGKHLVLDGVDGVLRVNRRRDQYGPVLTGVLMHIPSAKGKKSARYLEIKQQLHDDWDTDLTGSERAGEIAEKFCVFASDAPTNPRVRSISETKRIHPKWPVRHFSHNTDNVGVKHYYVTYDKHGFPSHEITFEEMSRYQARKS